MFGKTQISQPSNLASSFIALKGKFLHVLTVKSKFSPIWIVDSGASDHMTGDINLLADFQPCKQDWMVRIADGSQSRVVGIGSVEISGNLVLKSVFLVPSLDCNLILVRKLTTDSNCVAKFSQNSCKFQDRSSGRTIGNAEICFSLYILKGTSHSSKYSLFNPSVCLSHSNNNSAIMLWHYRLGHPNFIYLRKLFPALFMNKDSHVLQCEIFHFSRHI